MANKHPYVNSIGGLSKTIQQFRSSFPTVVDAATLQKLGFAPNNESYILNILRVLGFIDEDGMKTDAGASVFSHHDDRAFEAGFAPRVKAAYAELFDLHGEATWTLDRDSLISFFRTTDQTSDVVGRRQANTFALLATLSGRESDRERGQAKPTSATERPRRRATRKSVDEAAGAKSQIESSETRSVGLTVRIEINLPSDGDQATYDRIFKSIRENFIAS